MTDRIYRPCSGSSSCPNPGTVRGRCPAHAAEWERARDLVRSEDRTIRNSARWQRLRRAFLRDNPWCSWPNCFDAATDVDHITPISSGGDPWNVANLQGLCHRHHSRKTATEDRRRGNRKEQR